MSYMRFFSQYKSIYHNVNNIHIVEYLSSPPQLWGGNLLILEQPESGVDVNTNQSASTIYFQSLTNKLKLEADWLPCIASPD